MSEQLLNAGWFFKETTPAGQVKREYRQVTLPHDWLIYDAKHLYEDSIGWYRRELTQQEIGKLQKGGHLFLRFEGVYMDCTLYVNGKMAGEWKYGYSTFSLEITPYLKKEKNSLLLQVVYQSPNSRWYTGAGIYRNVWLVTEPPVYLTMDGLYVTTQKEQDGRYRMKLSAELTGNVTGEYETVFELVKNRQCLYQWTGKQQGEIFSCETDAFAAEEWSIERPVCYEVQAILYHRGIEMSRQRATVGFRTFALTPDQGLFLNGKHVKIHGVCEHHDLGCLGAAYWDRAMERKLRILKEMGVNAVRTSHNMPAPGFMELADRMGLLVVSEAFDMWEQKKTTYDYARFFDAWAEKDVASWIRRDRNHPSVLLWSIGNEIYDTHAGERGQELTRLLSDLVRRHDPDHHAEITLGSNYMPWENAQKCADILKVAGYNYGEKYYQAHHQKHPDWVIYGSETSSIVQSRGVYHFPIEAPILSEEDEQCSSLGNSTTSWGARDYQTLLAADRDTPYSMGQFLWSGFDYIGEPTPYHTKNSYFGQIDTAGFPKDSYYQFQAEWRSLEECPVLHLYPYWDFNEGQLIDVCAVSNAPVVELFVNGVSAGKQKLEHHTGTHLKAVWKVPYHQGEIRAVAYNKKGKPVMEKSRKTFADPVKLQVKADKVKLLADGYDLSFLDICAADQNGLTVDNAMNYVKVQVTGAGRLVGLDNGDSTDDDSYKGTVRKLFNGHLLAVVASGYQAGNVKICVTGEGLEKAEMNLTVEKTDRDVHGETFPVAEKSLESNDDRWLTKRAREMPGQARKIEIVAKNGQCISLDNQILFFKAKILPAAVREQPVIWKLVNDRGIEVQYARLQTDGLAASVTANGDGRFRIRCMTENGTGKVKLISELELEASGYGQAFLNPYQEISAGLYAGTVGEISNGNERGVATARDGASGIYFSDIDFGPIGSDVLTLPIFALDAQPHQIQIWNGKPRGIDATLTDTLVYQKPSVWNTYQPETFRLSKRWKGICRIGFLMQDKLHLRGFCFKKYEKAFERLQAESAERVYGDSYQLQNGQISKIGNNVTLEFFDMDFGMEGTDKIVIKGHTSLPQNTIHIRFCDENQKTENRIVEFSHTEETAEMQFDFAPVYGKQTVTFLFLPGSEFDFESFQFYSC